MAELATETSFGPAAHTAGAAPPHLAIGRTQRGGIGPSIFALVERGALKRPEIANALRGVVALRFRGDVPPVTIRFEEGRIVVEDAGPKRPNLTVTASLADVVLLTTAPLRMGMPSPADGRGRAVLGRMATGRIRISGDMGLARGMLELMRIDVPAHRTHDASPAADAGPEPGWIDVLT
jgi:putative sterol carrier protein